MSEGQAPGVTFEGVWKKFRRGELHDSLRDLIPFLASRALSRRASTELRTDDFWVLEDVSFEVGPGDALGIIGPNGAGKSTTLKLLSRIIRPTRGRVTVRGRVGALIELAAGFHPDLTGRENVFLQGAIMGMRQADIRTRFDQIVAFSGVEDFIDTPVKRYSSGMNARLGFSIAAHLDPEVLLIDEVLAVGDLSFRKRCHERLKEIRDSGIPLVFVSHNLQAVASLCDRALLLRRGRQPLLGDVAAAIEAHTDSSLSSSDARVEVENPALVHDATGRDVSDAISPGEWLHLSARLRIVEELGRCGASLAVFRSDGVRVFDGILTTQDDQMLHLGAGSSLDVSVRFRANLLKGHYSVGLVLFDENRQKPHVRLEGLTSFTVEEETRSAGYAELEPDARFELHA
jgi:homopolymeric O-antigen transport system ATP-binding protein